MNGGGGSVRYLMQNVVHLTTLYRKPWAISEEFISFVRYYISHLRDLVGQAKKK